MIADMRTSVVIPARDAEKTISQTLDSLLVQTDRGWEALIVDDGSIDGTSAIVAEYAARDSRFVALHAFGRGASAARNIGISCARGERILFLDSDDWIDRHFLANMNSALNDDPAAVAAYCNDCRVMPDGSETSARRNPHIGEDPFEAFARTCATAIHSVLVKRSAVLEAGCFDINLRTCEDWDLWQRIARGGGNWIHLDEKLSYYRVSDHSLTENIQQMLADAHVVISRGFSQDARVPHPARAHRTGVSTTSDGAATAAYAYFALWCAGVECGRGKIAGVPRPLFADIPRSETAADAIACTLLDSITVGARAIPANLARGWPQFGRYVTDLITAIGEAWNDPAGARKVQYRFERMLLDYDDLSAPRPLTLTLGLRVDIRRLQALRLPNNVDRLYVYLCDGPKILAVLDIGVLGEINRQFWVRLITEYLSHFHIENGRERLRRQEHKISNLIKRFRNSGLSNPNSHQHRLDALQNRMSCQTRPRSASSPVTSGNSEGYVTEKSHRDIGRSIVRNGAVRRRSEVAQSERRSHVPILMYHQIAADGPEELARHRIDADCFAEQMLWLRRNGYHTINSEQLAWFIVNDYSFEGRPLLITFDDGYEGFAEQAWPILKANDLSAEVFIVTDLVGRCAEWDASFGTPAALMDADKIVTLAAEGVSFGSHLASHPRSDRLSSAELAEELLRSRIQLEQWLERPATSLAAPFGCTDQRLRILAAECGYKTVFNTVNRAARLNDDPFDLPRIEVRGDRTLEAFVRCLEQYQ